MVPYRVLAVLLVAPLSVKALVVDDGIVINPPPQPVPPHAAVVGGVEVSVPGVPVAGRTSGEYTALWWKYVLEIPASGNPTMDQAGERFNPGPYTSAGMTFLYGNLTGAAQVSRAATVTAGTSVLVPLVNWVNLKTDPGETPSFLLDQLAPSVAGTHDLFATINGESFETVTGSSLLDYRETYPLSSGDTTFGVTFPSTDALYGFDGFSTDLMVADGHWLLLKNLPLGTHVVSFGGISSVGSITDVTYILTAVPLPGAAALFATALVGLGVGWRRKVRE